MTHKNLGNHFLKNSPKEEIKRQVQQLQENLRARLIKNLRHTSSAKYVWCNSQPYKSENMFTKLSNKMFSNDMLTNILKS